MRGVGAGRSAERGTSGATTSPRGAAGPHNPEADLARSAPPNPEADLARSAPPNPEADLARSAPPNPDYVKAKGPDGSLHRALLFLADLPVSSPASAGRPGREFSRGSR